MGALLVVPALVEDLEENLAALAVYSNRDACPVDQAEAPEAAYVAADLVVALDTLGDRDVGLAVQEVGAHQVSYGPY